MIEAQLKGMQGLPRKLHRQFPATAVGDISHHGVIDVGAMHADLVRASRIELEAQQGVIAESLLEGPVRARVATAFITHHRIFFAIHRMTSDRAKDRSRLSLRHPMHHSQILA